MKRLMFVLAATAFLSSPAGARPRSTTYEMSEAEAREAMRDYVGCVVKDSPEAASRAVVEDWGRPMLVGSEAKLVSPRCTRAGGFVAQLKFQPVVFRGLIAERLLATDAGLAPSREAVLPLAPLVHHQPYAVATTDKNGKPLSAKAIASQQDGYNRRVSTILGEQIAECMVKRDPAAVRPLFATAVGTPEEMAALRALSAGLPACVPAAKQFTFDKVSLRGSLATAYYRLAMASRGVTWTGDATGAPQ